ncbi:MAG: N-acetylmuramic acid 6-phosphate etherase [Candidatus Melainabacteria bacterium]|nr:N-acetylmuramic acid 6-phosphate etherase [Candidatus Melainabacteria bacterium]
MTALSLFPTEQMNPRTQEIDQLPTEDVLKLINQEDQTVASVVAQAIPQIIPVVEAAKKALQTGGRLFYVGAGTSGRLGVLDAAECPPTFSTPAEWVQGIIAGGSIALQQAVEGAEDSAEAGAQDIQTAQVKENDVVIGLSASGGAAYVLAAMQTARQFGAVTACITCNPNGKLFHAVTYPVVAEVGPEVIAGSTRMKAGTAQKLILNMISTATMVRLGKTYQNLMVDVRPTNLKLRDRAARIVATLAGVSVATAQETLDACHFEVKTAIVMQRCNVDAATARKALARHEGQLRRTLEHQNEANLSP